MAPYVVRMREALGLPPNQVAILLLDCWSVHRGAPFRTWLAVEYPYMKLLFVPAGCTSKLQPCDVALQKPFKQGALGAWPCMCKGMNAHAGAPVRPQCGCAVTCAQAL